MGVNVDVVDGWGWTPLRLAKVSECSVVIPILLEVGASEFVSDQSRDATVPKEVADITTRLLMANDFLFTL